MRIILGIILGIMIVFNWSSIKSLFDYSLASQAGKVDKIDQTLPAHNSSVEPVNQQQSLSDSVKQRLKDAAGKH